MKSRYGPEAFALGAALLCGIALIMLLLSTRHGARSGPVVMVTALRTNGGAIVTALLPESYQPAATQIVPINGSAKALAPPAVSMSITHVTNGTQLDYYLVDDLQTPLSLRIFTKSPTGGYSGFAGRLRDCWKFSNLQPLFGVYYDDVVDFQSEAILFGEAEPNGSTNLVAKTMKATWNERVTVHVGP